MHTCTARHSTYKDDCTILVSVLVLVTIKVLARQGVARSLDVDVLRAIGRVQPLNVDEYARTKLIFRAELTHLVQGGAPSLNQRFLDVVDLKSVVIMPAVYKVDERNAGSPESHLARNEP